MTNRIRLRLTALLLAGATLTGACDSFLSGPGIDQNPNSPTAASRNNLFVGFQAVQFANFEGFLARLTSMWTQQLAGVERQHFAYGTYDYTEDDISQEWTAYYTGGGLRDIRLIQESAKEDGDSLFGGIAKTWEALVMSQVAAQWGDIPFSAVGSVKEPAPLDGQEQVFSALQAKLDTALVWLDRTSISNAGPGSADFNYSGNRTKWKQLAHTIKARIYLYTAERVGTSAYSAAYDQALLGISTDANDFTTWHGTSDDQSNFWYQFQWISRTGDVLAGRYLVDLLKSRNDPRLEEYFYAWDGCEVEGADPGEGTGGCTSDINNPTDATGRLAPDFRQPWVTYDEVQLILAEAGFRSGKGNPLALVNNVRQRHGLAPLASLGSNPIKTIMEEKYIVLFQNPEVWSDYKRTCMPNNLTKVPGTSGLPGRLLYGFAERNGNPNIPLPSAQPARNWNDPNACP